MKNTFLHVDEAPPPMPEDLRRAKTAPGATTLPGGQGIMCGPDFDSASSCQSPGSSPRAQQFVYAIVPGAQDAWQMHWAPDGTLRGTTPDFKWPSPAVAGPAQMPLRFLPVMVPMESYGAYQPASIENVTGNQLGINEGAQVYSATCLPMLPSAPMETSPPTVPVQGNVVPTRPAQTSGGESGAMHACSQNAVPLGQKTAVAEHAGRAIQPQSLTQAFDPNTGTAHVRWTVDARKLRGNDKHAVSPHFNLDFGRQAPPVPFKMMIGPNPSDVGRGGASFKKACGRGIVQLKCESMSETALGVIFRFAIGNTRKKQPPCRSIEHNFAVSAIANVTCEQSRDPIEWDFTKAVDQESMTFDVFLEIVLRAY